MIKKLTLNKLSKKERAAKGLFFTSAVFSVFAVFAIVAYMLYASIPAFKEIGFFNFVFGTLWAPDKEFLEVSERFGILPMIVGTLCVTSGAILIGGTIGLFTAIFINGFCPKKTKGVFSQLINFLAGIPSIIYGFFGLVVIVPLLQQISPTGSGKGILASSIILGIMILPTVTSMTVTSLDEVPKNYYEGALALGCTKEQAFFKARFRAAKSGITSGMVLGIGRAVGETMAVMMVAGNAPIFPEGLFSNIRTLTINMVLEMGYATGIHKQALLATGVILLAVVLLLNFGLSFLKRNKKTKDKNRKKTVDGTTTHTAVYEKGGMMYSGLKWFAVLCASLITLVLFAIVIFVFIKGVPYITPNFLFGESGNSGMTLRPAFVSTGLIILISLAIALPLGIGTAVFLVEYSKRDSRIVKFIRLFVDTLAGIPSIIYGFFGMILFSELMGLGYSLLSGALTISIMILPTIVRSTEESLLSVQDSLREGSFALGAGKLRTIFKIVLPSAISGILTAVILSIGRIVGESAALIYTSGAVAYTPASLLDSGPTFAVMMWMFASEGHYINQAYATAVVLMIIVLVLNLLVHLVGKKLKKGQAE